MPSAIVTTSDLDRHRDRIDYRGIDCSKYLKERPWVTIGHVRAMRVGRLTALTFIDRVGIQATWDWLNSTLAMKARAAFERGQLDGASIGLQRIKAVANHEGGRDISSGVLDDVTLVPKQYAANPQTRTIDHEIVLDLK